MSNASANRVEDVTDEVSNASKTPMPYPNQYLPDLEDNIDQTPPTPAPVQPPPYQQPQQQPPRPQASNDQFLTVRDCLMQIQAHMGRELSIKIDFPMQITDGCEVKFVDSKSKKVFYASARLRLRNNPHYSSEENQLRIDASLSDLVMSK